MSQSVKQKQQAMYDEWLVCDIKIRWMLTEKHTPISNCKVFVAMQDGEVRPAYYETNYGFSDGCGECGGLLEPEYWTHNIRSPQDWIEENNQFNIGERQGNEQ